MKPAYKFGFQNHSIIFRIISYNAYTVNGSLTSQFGAGNILSATNGTNTYSGTWSVTSDNSNDDSPSNDLDFNIAFAAPANFADLTDDWNIISYTATKIQLIHVSGGGGGTDYITFEKN